MPERPDELEEAVGPDRRTFVRNLVVGTVFVSPVMSSFLMSGVDALEGRQSTTIAINCNSSPPPPPSRFPVEVACFCLNTNATVTFTATDGTVPLSLTVPAGALFVQTQICIFRGDLTALRAAVPAGQVPVSAYAVKWNSFNLMPPPTANSALTFVVDDPAVAAGNPIFAVDSGSPVNAGTAGNAMWTESFTSDPSFVVTQTSATAPATPVVTGPQFTG